MKLPFRSGAIAAVALLLPIGLYQPLKGQESTGRVTGRVVDAATSRPLVGVQVFVPPTGIGNITDQNGRFVLANVPVGEHTITAQLVGYAAGEVQVAVPAGDAVAADFQLTQTAIDLDEIVVTGAGIATEKRKLGNSIATIDASELETAPITDFSQILQGREPGLVSLPSSGYTGAGSRIRIRGSSSLSQLNEPIIYVDGVRVDRSAGDLMGGTQSEPSRLDDIPPDAIERVEVLKGAAAATLYGTEASNGVIQVFTKKGQTGSPRFTFGIDFSGVSIPTDRIEPMADFAREQEDIDRISERWGRNVELYEVFQEDIMSDVFRTGFQQVYSGSVSGGGGLINYYVSGRFQDENGPLAFNEYFEPAPGLDPAQDKSRRMQAKANLTVTPHDNIRIGISTLYTEADLESPDNANNIYGLFTSAMFGQLRLATRSNLFGNAAFATARETQYQINRNNAKHFAGSVNVNYAPLQALTLDGTFGVDFVSEASERFRPFGWNVDDFTTAQTQGQRILDEIRNHLITADFKLAWESLPTEDLSNTFLAGVQGLLRQRTNKGGQGARFPGPGFGVAEAGADQFVDETWVRETQAGGYLQDQIGWRNWAFLTLGGRWDAHSAFGEEFATAFYPKASISVVPTDAFGWEGGTLSTLRLRAAIGTSGLQPSAFDKFTTYGPLPSEDGPGVEPDNLGNNALEPEVSTELEFGTEIGLFNNRASLEATYWTREVRDAIVDRQFPVTGGFRATQAINIGKVEAHGFEVSADARVVETGQFSLGLFATGSFLSEEIADLGEAPAQKTGGSYSRYRNFLAEGFAPGAYFGAQLAEDLAIPLNILGDCTEPTHEQALEYFSEPRDPSDFKPLVYGNDGFGNRDGLASPGCGEDMLLSYLGKPTPDWNGSFGFNASWGDFELHSLFEYNAGNFYWHDLTGEFRRANPGIGRNLPRARELEATLVNPESTAEERLDAALEWARNYEGLAPLDGLNAIKPADFVRWRELSLTYRVPLSLIEQFGLTSAVLSVGARNLKLWVNDQYPGIDPEINLYSRCNGGLDCNFASVEAFGVPMTRRFTFSTRVSF